MMIKKMIFMLLFLTSISEINAQAYQYKIITSIESVVPMGLGRSRIIDEQEEKNYQDYTSSRSEENNKQNKSKRSEAKVDNFEETKILNFYSAAGINFQNIASNDALLSSKVNTMIDEGWELAFVTSAVESDAGKGDGQGIFITRFIFKKLK
jgi:arginyl-tRNA synthetase